MTSVSEDLTTLGSLNYDGISIGLGSVNSANQLSATYTFTPGVGTITNARLTLSGTSPVSYNLRIDSISMG